MQSAQKSCSKQSSGAGSLSIVSSTLMGGVVTMGLLMWGMENIFRIDHKQCEFRFNYQDQDLYKLLINIIRKKSLF